MSVKAPDRALDSLVLDLLEWLSKEPRTYAQTMDAWRTSCPRLTVWEEALERGLVERKPARNGGVRVSVTGAGRSFLTRNGRLGGLA
jgi:hypothetical protein